jgi:hypothetical protein
MKTIAKTAMRIQIVKDARSKYDVTLNTENPNWKQIAQTLMNEKMTFIVEDWDFSFNNQESTALVKGFGYKYSFDHNSGQAFFKPRVP